MYIVSLGKEILTCFQRAACALITWPNSHSNYLLINDDMLRGNSVVRQIQIHVGSHYVNPYFEAFAPSYEEEN